MPKINIKSPSQWVAVEITENIILTPPEGGSSLHTVVFNSPGKVAAYVEEVDPVDNSIVPGSKRLLAYGEGFFEASFSMSTTHALTFDGADGMLVYLQQRDGEQVIAKSSDVVFTTIEPRNRGSNDLAIMQRMMRQNSLATEARLRAELDAMRARLATEPELIDNRREFDTTDTPEPDPTETTDT